MFGTFESDEKTKFLSQSFKFHWLGSSKKQVQFRSLERSMNGECMSEYQKPNDDLHS